MNFCPGSKNSINGKTGRYDIELCHFYKVSLIKTGLMFHKYHLLNQLQVFMRYKKNTKMSFNIPLNKNNSAYTLYYILAGVVSTLTDFDYEDLLTKGLVTCDLIVGVNDGRESATVKRLRVVVNDVNEQQTGFREARYFITADEGQVLLNKGRQFIV